MSDEDPYLWLEDVSGDAALAWVRERNAETVDELTGSPGFKVLEQEMREVLDDDGRIPWTVRRGGHLYNFWQDADHVRGLWRRTTLEEYRTDRPAWEVLLDLDALAEAEGEKWAWAGSRVLAPEHRHALVLLSRDGADACVVREFDLETLAFVEDGFAVAEAKTRIGWIDHDRVWIGTDFGAGSMSSSGYPLQVRRWRRGTPLADAELVYEGRPTDLSASGWHDDTPGFARDFVHRQIDFWNHELFLLQEDAAGPPLKIDVPDDAGASVHRRWLTVTTKSPWLGHPAGSLLAFDFDAFRAGEREAEVLFTPDERTALAGYSWTRDHLILSTRADVSSRMELLTPGGEGPGGWRRAPLPGLPPLSTASVTDTDPDVGDEYFHQVSGFLQPATLYRGTAGDGRESESLKQSPALFDTAGLAVRQYFATSADGTRVPYFVVGPEDRPGPGPTLLYGYGGFEISMVPQYSAVTGRAWLARGGTYVVAGIRGGHEYGPGWHKAALGANRVRAYEDFAAVARDLTARDITTPPSWASRAAATAGCSWAPCSPATPNSSARSSRTCRCWTCCASTSCWPEPAGSPSTGIPTARPTGRTWRGSPRTTGSGRRGPRTRRCSCSPRPATTGCTRAMPARWPPGCVSTGIPSSSTSTSGAVTRAPPTTGRRPSTRPSSTPSCGSG